MAQSVKRFRVLSGSGFYGEAICLKRQRRQVPSCIWRCESSRQGGFKTKSFVVRWVTQNKDERPAVSFRATQPFSYQFFCDTPPWRRVDSRTATGAGPKESLGVRIFENMTCPITCPSKTATSDKMALPSSRSWFTRSASALVGKTWAARDRIPPRSAAVSLRISEPVHYFYLASAIIAP